MTRSETNRLLVRLVECVEYACSDIEAGYDHAAHANLVEGLGAIQEALDIETTDGILDSLKAELKVNEPD